MILDDPVYAYTHSLFRGAKLYLIRERDGKPLAKGYNRTQMERTRDVFRGLGVPCRVVKASTGGTVCQGENESRSDFLRRDRADRAVRKNAP